MASTVNPILTSNKDGEDTVWAFRISQASSGGSSGVSRIVAGTNVTVSPAGGTGVVTVNSSGSGGAVASVTADPAGVGLTSTPTTGAVVVKNTQPASTWSTFAATQNVSINAYKLCMQAVDSLYQYIKYESGVDGVEIAGYAGGRLVSTGRPSGTITPALTWTGADVQVAQILTSTELRFYPYNDGFQYIKYVSAVNGPEIAGGSGGRLVATGPGPSPVVTTALTWAGADVTLGGKLNGHELYAYATVQATPGVITSIYANTLVFVPMNTVIVASAITFPSTDRFVSSKAGDYRITASLSINNFGTSHAVCDVFLYNFNLASSVTSTIRTMGFPIGYTTQVFTCTLPGYTPSREYGIGFYQSNALTRIQLDNPSYTPADVNIELMG